MSRFGRGAGPGGTLPVVELNAADPVVPGSHSAEGEWFPPWLQNDRNTAGGERIRNP